MSIAIKRNGVANRLRTVHSTHSIDDQSKNRKKKEHDLFYALSAAAASAGVGCCSVGGGLSSSLASVAGSDETSFAASGFLSVSLASLPFTSASSVSSFFTSALSAVSVFCFLRLEPLNDRWSFRESPSSSESLYSFSGAILLSEARIDIRSSGFDLSSSSDSSLIASSGIAVYNVTIELDVL